MCSYGTASSLLALPGAYWDLIREQAASVYSGIREDVESIGYYVTHLQSATSEETQKAKFAGLRVLAVVGMAVSGFIAFKFIATMTLGGLLKMSLPVIVFVGNTDLFRLAKKGENFLNLEGTRVKAAELSLSGGIFYKLGVLLSMRSGGHNFLTKHTFLPFLWNPVLAKMKDIAITIYRKEAAGKAAEEAAKKKQI